MTVLQALSGDTAVCRSLISPVLHPSALPRVIVARRRRRRPPSRRARDSPTPSARRARTATNCRWRWTRCSATWAWWSSCAPSRTSSRGTRRASPRVASPSPPQHETALMIFPIASISPEIRKTPPRRGTPPRRRHRRHPRPRGVADPQGTHEETVRVLPLHSALPETWTARDPGDAEPLAGREVGAALYARRLVVGREEGEDLEEKDAAEKKKTEKDVEEAEREAEAAAKALEMAEARSASAEEATPPGRRRDWNSRDSSRTNAPRCFANTTSSRARDGARGRRSTRHGRRTPRKHSPRPSFRGGSIRGRDEPRRRRREEGGGGGKRSDARDESDVWNLDAFRNAIAELAPKWEKTATMAPSDVPPLPPAAYAAIRFIATVLDKQDAEKFRVTDDNDDDDDDAQEGEPAPEKQVPKTPTVQIQM